MTMGIGSLDLELLIKLREMELLRDGSAVMEIGTQQLATNFLVMKERIAYLGRLFNIERPSALPEPRPSHLAHADLEHLDGAAPAARDFWLWLGLDYAAIDIDSSPGSVALDLNYDSVPPEMEGKFNLVTNFGTTEHVANQLNAFKIIHDLTERGGIMLHRVPAQGMVNHGLVNYNFKFFWMLARSNGYSFIYADFQRSRENYNLPSNIGDFLGHYDLAASERARNCAVTDATLLAVLKKSHNFAFVPPIDVPTGATTDIEALKRRYWTVFERHSFD
jgi:hypothetical protein